MNRVHLIDWHETVEDLPDLIDALARQVGKRPEDVGTAARAVLVRRLWPGNVAELAAVIADAAVRSAGKTILPEHLTATPGESVDPPESSASLSEGLDLGYHAAVRTFRGRLLRHALETTGGNRTRAAKLLGLNRDQIRYRIEKFGL